MAFISVRPALVLLNNTTKDIRVFGMKIKPGRKVDIFESVVGLTEERVIAAMSPPNGEIYIKMEKGELTAISSRFTTFENDPGFESSDIITTSDDYTASKGSVLLCDAASKNLVITLPPAISNSGRRLEIKKIDDSVNTVTIITQGADTIDGETEQVIEDQYVALTIVASGTAYYLV